MTKSSSESASVLRADLDKQPEQIASMFDHVSKRYDLMNTVMTGGMDHVWLRALAKAVDARPGERVLDLAAGTGSSSAVIACSGAEVIACDLSAGMIEVGRERHPHLTFVQGNAMDLEFEDESFDAVTISYGLRNIPDPELALREMLRVTKPGGRLVVNEFSTPTNPIFAKLYQWHLGVVMPWLAGLASSDDVAYDYLVESILAWPDQQGVGGMLKNAGWQGVEFRNLTGGIVALHRGFKAI